jgi:hypothetical protein
MPHHPDGLLVVPNGVQVQYYPNPQTPGGEHHWRTTGSLFRVPPAANDVMQGDIGDCYLIGALVGILNCPGGTAAIEECFLDRSGYGPWGEVVVRLYNGACAPQYIKINKTVPGAPTPATVWVKLLEKAYAALFAKGAYAELEEMAGKMHGRASDVFRAILGHAAEGYGCSKNDWNFVQLMGLTSFTNSPNATRQVRDAVFRGDQGLVDGWRQWFTREKHTQWMAIVRTSVVYKQDDFEEFLKGPGADMPANVRDQLLYWINTEYILPGRRGSGLYTIAQRNIFGTIRGALTRKEAVAAGTHQGVAKRGKYAGAGGAGEGKSIGGLVGGHQYAVLDTKEEEGLFWLQLRNPWGSWGMKYERGVHGPGPKEGRKYLRPRYDETAGVFWIELSDFCKHFQSVYASGKALT